MCSTEEQPPQTVSEASKRRYAFDVLFLKRLFGFHRIFFPSLRCLNALLFCALLAVSGAEQFLAYKVGLVTGQFYEVLGNRDLAGFRRVSLNSLLVILAMTAAKSLRQFVCRSMIVGWRRSLTIALHKLYFADIHFYRLNVLGKEPDSGQKCIP